MDALRYVIDGKELEVSVAGSPEFRRGGREVLSNAASDITFSQPWYEQGYHVARFLDGGEFGRLVEGLTRSIGGIVGDGGDGARRFELRRYHRAVRTDEAHLKVVSRTRDLFADDFSFPVTPLVGRLERLLGFPLTDVDPSDGSRMHIIVRINRPLSGDFNPPHKDIYESVDRGGPPARIVNFWIPICGVTPRSSLPLAPSSHLLPEDQILRTFDGGVVDGRRYRVRAVQSWGGSNRMTRAKVGDGDVLVFSSHLIHGLAVNEERDQTRVSLEFRLFRRD